MGFEEIWALNKASPVTHSFDLSVYISKKSAWTKQGIRSRLEKANQALGTCGVGIQHVYVHDWLPSNPKLRVDDYISDKKYYDGLRHASVKSKKVTAIELFYFEDYSENFQSGPSVPLAIYPSPKLEPATYNTAWFPYSSAQRLFSRGSSYNEEAHEIGHIFLQSGHDHSGAENIMANNSKKRTSFFTKNQCETIRNHPAIGSSAISRMSSLFSTYYQKYSRAFYMSDWCSRNVLNLSRALYRFFDMNPNQTFAVFAVHKEAERSFKPLRARQGRLVSWKFHAFLVIDGWVFDLDYSDQPQVVPLREYLQNMFGNQANDLRFQLRDPLDGSTITYNEVLKSFQTSKTRRFNNFELIDGFER